MITDLHYLRAGKQRLSWVFSSSAYARCFENAGWRPALCGLICLGAAQTGLANRVLERPELVFATETRIPKIAGVPPLVAQPPGESPVYYKKLRFQGERHYAFGPYAPDNSFSSAVGQERSRLSGEINYSYSGATDSIVVSNTTQIETGQVSSPAPWHVQDGPFGVLPVLTVSVPLTVTGNANAGGGNNPLNLAVIDATHAGDDNQFEYWSNTQALFGSFSAFERQHNYQMVLSETDTPAQAEARARRYQISNELNYEGQSSIRQIFAHGPQWLIRTVNVTFKYQCCSGLYEMVRRYDRRATGTLMWSAYREEREARQVEEGDWSGAFPLPLEPGYEIRLADLTIERKNSSCTGNACGDHSVAGLGLGPRPGSIAWDMPLGLDAAGRAIGILSLYSRQITPALYSPAALTCAVSGPAASIIRDTSDVIRQILTTQSLVDVVVTSLDAYEVRVYDRTAAGSAGPDGLYSPAGAPYVTWRVDNPGGTHRWRMSRIIGSATEVTQVDESTAGVRVFTEANGLRISEISQTTEGSDRVETIVVKDSAGTVSSKRKVHYRTFNLGEEKVKEVLDPDGAALTTIWTYSTANNHTYQKLVSIQHPDGYLEQMQYSNETGIMLNRTVPLLRNATKYTGFTRTLSDLNTDGFSDRLWAEVDAWHFTTGTGGSFTIDWGGTTLIGGVTYALRETKRVVSPGAAWNAASNLTTKERYYADGRNDGRLAYRLSPDRTLQLNRSTTNPDGTTITTEEQGAADPSGEIVIDGTRTVRTRSERGFPVSTLVTDIATGLVLSAETVGRTDDFGRPTEILHPDGAVETRAYCLSCGAVDRISLRGETINHVFDQLKRKVRETRLAGTTVLASTRFEYDADGRLVKTWRVNPADQTETLQASTTYDLAGRVTATTSLESGITGYSYAFGTANSTIITTTYADGGTRIESRGSSGTIFKLTGTSVAPLEYLWFPGGGGSIGSLMRTLRYYSPTQSVTEESGINYLGAIAYTTFADGSRINHYFDAIGRLARTVDPDGVTTLYGYDAQGRQAVSAIDLNANNVIDYNGADRISRTLYAVGSREGHTVQRRTAQNWETAGSDTPADLTISEQSTDGLRSWQTIRGLTTSTVVIFDGAGGRTITSTAPAGAQTTQTYLGDRLQSAVTSHPSLGTLGSISQAYNDLGQLTSTSQLSPLNTQLVTTYAYDASDRLHSVTTPDPDASRSGPGYDPQTTTFDYDVMGRQASVTQPDGGVVSTTYWLHGGVKRTWGSRTYPIEYTYDIQNRVKTLTTWQNFAGDAGKAVTTWYYTNERGFLQNKRYADNTGPGYGYKPSGRLQSRTWARGVSTSYSYNAAGDLTFLNYSDATPDVTVAYARDGRVTSITDGSGTRTLDYDASGQLDAETYTAGLLNGLSVDRTFDSLTRLSGVTALNAQPSVLSSVTYGYDEASRLSSVTVGTHSATYGYGPNSTLVGSVTFKQGGTSHLTTTKTYDNLNRLTSIVNTPSSPLPAPSYLYSYNSANQRTVITREDNSRWEYGYDALGQVTSGKRLDAANALMPGHDFAWTYDDIGNRKTATANSRLSTYSATLLNTYSSRTVPGAFDLLAAAQAGATVSYQYPADTGAPQPLPRDGELLHQQLTADNSATNFMGNVKVIGVKNHTGTDGEDALTEITRGVFLPKTPEQFTHDADGNLIVDGKWIYAWDAENRLSKMSLLPELVQAGLPRRIVEFAYDSFGRRVSKQVTDLVQIGTSGTQTTVTTTRNLYDGWNLVAEVDSTGAAVRAYAWGLDLSGSLQGAGGVGGLLFTSYTLNLTPCRAAAAYDGNGNVIGLVDMSTGAKSATYEYNAFGETIISDGIAASANPFRFSTKYTDTETGLLNYGLRHYSPGSGRWPSRDPIGERGGVNLYGFVNNAPTRYVDKLGLLLAAVDGTGSWTWRDFDRKTRRWNSHVRNFYMDYKGPGPKQYWDGPANATTGSDSPGIHQDVIKWICTVLKDNPSEPINLLGHSRGGYIVMQIAKELKEKGCACIAGANTTTPIRINFIGLYDPVDMVMGYGDGQSVPSNVDYAANALGDPDVGSRPYFNTSDGGAQDVSKMKAYDEMIFDATHGGMGGDPWGGDHPKGMTEVRDRVGSSAADAWMRERAKNAGIQLNETP